MRRYDPQFRRGLTKTEVAIVCVCIVILAALIPLALNSLQRPGRQSQCYSYLRSFAQASIMYESRHGRFHGYLDRYPRYPANENIPEKATPSVPLTWVAAILPNLDHRSVYENVISSEMNSGIDADGTLIDRTALFPELPFLHCPENPNEGNSYVLNTGTFVPPAGIVINGIEFDRSTAEAFANSLFVNHYDEAIAAAETDSPKSRFTLDAIRDGLSMTMLFTERLDAPRWYQLAADPTDMRARLWPEKYLDPAALELLHGVGFTFASGDQEPRLKFVQKPSSGHSGGWVMSFADGSVRFINDEIDEVVLMHLLLPDDQASIAAELGILRGRISKDEL